MSVPSDNINHPDYSLLYRRMASIGISLIPLQPKGKVPLDNNWTTLAKLSPDELLQHWRPPQNLGIRTGHNSQLINGEYLVAIDLDISSAAHEAQAYEKLEALCPWYKGALEIKSGSALGKSRHFIFTTERPLASRRLFDSDEKVIITLPDGTEKTKSAFQIDFFGNGRQFVCAGSIHPDNGMYEILDMQKFEEFLTLVGSKQRANNHVSFDTLTGLVFPPSAQEETNLGPIPDRTVEEIQALLEKLPPDHLDDYTKWTEVGFALHAQFNGAAIGLETFKIYSSMNPSKYSESACVKVWNSIKPRKGQGVLTLRTLVARADRYQTEKIFQNAIGIGDYSSTDTKWIEELDREPKKKGAIVNNSLPALKPTIKNVSMVLTHDPRLKGLIAFNEMTNTIVLKRSFETKVPGVANMICSDTMNGDAWKDIYTLNLKVLFETWNSAAQWHIPKASVNLIHEGVCAAAVLNKFHPVKEYLLGQTWDKTPRLSSLFSEYLGIDESEYTKELSTKFMVGACQRVFEPGCKFDMVVILEGKQGIRKTTFLSLLAVHPKFFNSLTYHTGFAAKANVENIQGIWINELSETSGMGRANIEELKSFLTNQVDKFRPSYGRYVQEFPRQGVFVGSTNDLVLADLTGNRRYHPLSVVAVNTEALERDRNQLWAEAYLTYKQMREETPFPALLPLYLQNMSALETVELLREEHTQEDETDGTVLKITEWMRANSKVRILSSPQIVAEILKQDLADFSTVGSSNAIIKGKAIRRAMDKIPGWRHRGRQVTKYGTLRLWTKMDGSSDRYNSYHWEALEGKPAPAMNTAAPGVVSIHPVENNPEEM